MAHKMETIIGATTSGSRTRSSADDYRLTEASRKKGILRESSICWESYIVSADGLKIAGASAQVFGRSRYV